MRSLGCLLTQYDGCPFNKGKSEPRHAQRKMMWRNRERQHTKERPGKEPTLQRSQPCQHLALDFQPPELRQCVSVDLSHPVCGICGALLMAAPAGKGSVLGTSQVLAQFILLSIPSSRGLQGGAKVGAQLFIWKVIQSSVKNNSKVNSVFPILTTVKPTFAPPRTIPLYRWRSWTTQQGHALTAITEFIKGKAGPWTPVSLTNAWHTGSTHLV